MNLYLKNIIAVSGEPGLYKILHIDSMGILLETIGSEKIRTRRHFKNSKMMCLNDISVYTLRGNDINEKLSTVLGSIFNINNGQRVDKDFMADKSKCCELFKKALPDYDSIRVKNQDIKKILIWYNIIVDNFYEEILNDSKES